MQMALDDLMVLISKPLVTATTEVISATLVVEREEPRHVYKVQ
jgi:hypothetical protein